MQAPTMKNGTILPVGRKRDGSPRYRQPPKSMSIFNVGGCPRKHLIELTPRPPLFLRNDFVVQLASRETAMVQRGFPRSKCGSKSFRRERGWSKTGGELTFFTSHLFLTTLQELVRPVDDLEAGFLILFSGPVPGEGIVHAPPVLCRGDRLGLDNLRAEPLHLRKCFSQKPLGQAIRPSLGNEEARQGPQPGGSVQPLIGLDTVETGGNARAGRTCTSLQARRQPWPAARALSRGHHAAHGLMGSLALKHFPVLAGQTVVHTPASAAALDRGEEALEIRERGGGEGVIRDSLGMVGHLAIKVLQVSL